jgi:uncharacterized membrane protein YoaK (UPF0700 family)
MAIRTRLQRLDPSTRLLVGLAAVAGWLDALSFLELGKVFTSFQSGNLIFLGLAIDEGDGALFAGAAVSLAALVAGSAVGAYVIGQAKVQQLSGPRVRAAFTLECALLVAFAICWQAVGNTSAHGIVRLVLIALAAAAMGIQGATVLALRLPGVMTNAMTATLNLAGALIGLRARGAEAERDASTIGAGTVAALCGSYVASAVLVGWINTPRVTSLVPAAGFIVVLAALALRRRAVPPDTVAVVR